MSRPTDIRPARKLQRFPQTSEPKARLCEGLRPVLTDFHETIRALAMKWPDRVAGDSVTAMADLLGEELRRLLRGEDIGDLYTRMRVEPGMTLLPLCIRTAAIVRALETFRRRYFGWHPALGAPGWHLTGQFGIDDARRLKPRSEERPGHGEQVLEDSPGMKLIKRQVAERLKKFGMSATPIQSATVYHRAPDPNSGPVEFDDFPKRG